MFEAVPWALLRAVTQHTKPTRCMQVMQSACDSPASCVAHAWPSSACACSNACKQSTHRRLCGVCASQRINTKQLWGVGVPLTGVCAILRCALVRSSPKKADSDSSISGLLCALFGYVRVCFVCWRHCHLEVRQHTAVPPPPPTHTQAHKYTSIHFCNCSALQLT